ncbi:hypothetical protein M433DRAFT_184431 [Acidomyces richmondensis BFW]|nr:hypothetical protein M433DRAFT_184431 [Acidomyces richmondensis BFW]
MGLAHALSVAYLSATDGYSLCLADCPKLLWYRRYHLGIFRESSQTGMPIFANKAPCRLWSILTTKNRVSLSSTISPFLVKQKFAIPPGMTILPISFPPAFQTFTPSQQPE